VKGTTPFIKLCCGRGENLNRFQRRERLDKDDHDAQHDRPLDGSDRLMDEANRDTVGAP